MVSNEGIEKALEDIETLKKGLAELTTDHAIVIKELKQQLLGLQQVLLALKINADVKAICDIMDTQLRKRANYTAMRTQIIADAAYAKQKIRTSTNPATLYTNFSKKWSKHLHDSGVNIIDF